uniref:Lipocalin n=1 Tax=Rhipicephalus zambeziensis TaxID=60191 RepID=A0A224YC35_9ACAR
MAPYILWVWLLVLIAVVIHPRLAANQVASAPQKKTGPWKFMNTGIIYLNLTTLEVPGIKCKVAMRTQINATARTFSQEIGVKSSETWKRERVDYTQIRKNDRLVKAFTSVNKKTNEYTTHTFPYVSDDCAVVKKRTNITRGDYSNVCELWVNYKFLESKPQNADLCTSNFKTHCKRYNATPYNIEDCQESVGKLILIG